MTILVGKVVSVDTSNTSEPTTADHPAGALDLQVLDAATFEPDGGIVVVGTYAYDYIEADTDLDVLRLTVPLAVAVPADTEVEVVPPAPEKVALVDLGGDGDASPVVVPHALIELLPDGIRDPDSQETVTVEHDGRTLRLLDVVGRDLARGVVDPDRLTAGVTGNIVQDPLMLTSAWTSAAPWAVTVDPDYSDCNFLRMTDTTGSLASYPLTSVFPVDPDRTVRVWIAFNHDEASDDASLISPVTVRLRLQFFTDPKTPADVPDAYYEWDLHSSYTWGIWDVMELTATQRRSCAHVQAFLEVEGVTAGNLDFCRPEVQVVWGRIQSSDYTQGAYGFSFDSHEAQVQNLQVIEEVGAASGSFDSLSVGGNDLVSEFITPLPRGGIAYDNSASGVNTASTSGGTELKTHEFAAGSIVSGRLYRLTINGHLQGSANDAYDVRVRYTINGTAPTLTSSVLPGATTRVNIGAGSSGFVSIAYFILPSTEILRLAITLQRALGSGSGFLYMSANDRRLQVCVEDLGLYAGAAAVGTLSQKSYADGTPPQPDPVTKTTFTFPATWTRSYRGSLDPVTGDPDDLWQGYRDTVETDARSLIGFDYAAIQAALANAAVTKVRLTFRVKQVTPVAPNVFDLYLRTHTHLSKPATWTEAAVTGTTFQPFNAVTAKAGNTYTFDLPSAWGSAFKAGTARGIAVGPYLDQQSRGFGKLYGMSTLVPSLFFETTK